mgnify:CR=1 FL=1
MATLHSSSIGRTLVLDLSNATFNLSVTSFFLEKEHLIVDLSSSVNPSSFFRGGVDWFCDRVEDDSDMCRARGPF